MSKEPDKNRGRQQATDKSPGNTGRQVSMKGTAEVLGKHGGDAITKPQHHKTPKAPKTPAAKSPAAKSPKKPAGKGRPTPKQSAPRTPAGKKRTSARVGRPDGPLARRRRARIRLLLILLLVVNVAVGVVWRDWAVSLAVLIGSVIVAPLVAALMLGRK